MTFWSALRSMGSSFGSTAWIPMGARCGPDPTPNLRKSGRAKTRRTAGTVTRELDEESISSCSSSIYLTRAFSWAHHNRPRSLTEDRGLIVVRASEAPVKTGKE